MELQLPHTQTHMHMHTKHTCMHAHSGPPVVHVHHADRQQSHCSPHVTGHNGGNVQEEHLFMVRDNLHSIYSYIGMHVQLVIVESLPMQLVHLGGLAAFISSL